MKISIAMTTYNGQRYIIQQLDSIRGQSLAACEVIIFDDCSCDNTPAIIGEYIKQHQLHNWHLHISKENMGYINNFYKSIKETTGDIIFLSDQDDIWHNDKLEKMTGLFEAHPDMHVLDTSFKKIDADGREIASKPRLNRANHNLVRSHVRPGALKKLHLNDVLWRNISPGCTIALTRRCKELFLDSCSEMCPHDWQINIYGALLGGLYFSNQILTDYRIHTNNAIGLTELSAGMRFAKKDHSVILGNAAEQAKRAQAFLGAKWQDDLGHNKKQIFVRYKKLTEKRLSLVKTKRVSVFIDLCLHMPDYIRLQGPQGIFDDMKVCFSANKRNTTE